MTGGYLKWLILCIGTIIVSKSIYVNCKLDATYERFVIINGTNIINLSAIRVKKYNRTTVVLNGEADVLVDFDNTYEVKMSLN